MENFPPKKFPVCFKSDFLFCYQLEKLSAFKGLIRLHQTHRYNFLILKSAEPHNATNYRSKLHHIHCPWDYLGHASQGDILELCLPTPVLLPGKPHGRRSLVGCSPWGHEESDTTERIHFHFSLSCIGEGNGNPLQCSCLENLRDGEAWWAAIYGVAQSRT